MTPYLSETTTQFKDFLQTGTVNWETKSLTTDHAERGLVMPTVTLPLEKGPK